MDEFEMTVMLFGYVLWVITVAYVCYFREKHVCIPKEGPINYKEFLNKVIEMMNAAWDNPHIRPRLKRAIDWVLIAVKEWWHDDEEEGDEEE